jgi:hypothetical protein
MTLRSIKKCIQYGFLTEARQLIEQADIIDISRDETNEKTNKHENTLPLLITCSLINNENSAYNLCVSLIEKGYDVNFTDINGLCALNYAIIFERVKLVELFLKTFDFNLESLHDCYNNSLLHYVFATNNNDIICLFTNIYKKYYNWDSKLLSNIKNCDNLSVVDLYNNYNDKPKVKNRSLSFNDRLLTSSNCSILQNRSLTAFNKKRHDDDAGTIFSSNENFFRNSNPIFIIKNIKQMYNSKLTMKTIAIIDKNCSNNFFQNENLNKGFQSNMLYKIKVLNRIKSSITTPLQPNCNKRKSNEINKNNQFFQLLLSKNNVKKSDSFSCLAVKSEIKNECWKNDISMILDDYAVLNTPSYRNGFSFNKNNTMLLETISNISNDLLVTNRQTKLSDEMNSSFNTARSSIINPNEIKQKVNTMLKLKNQN